MLLAVSATRAVAQLTPAGTRALDRSLAGRTSSEATLAGPFRFTVGDVMAGDTFTVDVTDAPCENVVVTFMLNGVVQDSQTAGVGGSLKFFAPTSSKGQLWAVIVTCPGGTSTLQSGLVD